jgi:antirestriction protein ArdC
MNDRIKSALTGILEKFQSGDIPEVIAIATFPIKNIPSAKWSLLNRTLMMMAETKDARGFHQWLKVKRQVKKGAKAITIFAPRFVREKKNDQENLILKGFLAVPVFRVEDTEGEPLDYEQIKLPELSLKEVAERWGIQVRTIPGNGKYYGCYHEDRNQIDLATRDESVFFHELAHAAHQRVVGQLKPETDPLEEIVAELSAEVLCRIVGKTSEYLGNSYRYIERYAQKLEMSPLAACLQVMGEVERVLNLILSPEAQDPQTAVNNVLLPGEYAEVL